MEAILETRNLSIQFGGVVGASEISISVDAGEVIGVIGANGAGKTTFVNLVTGYLRPSSGSIHYMGNDVTTLTPREITDLGIRRSFQIPQLFGEMTALENMLTAQSIAPKVTRSYWIPLLRFDTVEIAMERLEHFGIADSADQLVSMLPQGVRKILDIAMATVGAPQLVMLDEPTSGVSAEEKFEIMDIVMDAFARQEVTVLFIEHDMELVERYANRVLAFYNGLVIADTDTRQALANPQVREYVVGREIHRTHAPQGEN
ncbi:MAG: ATP-binding cassette domain-containing protein [Desulfobacteraceae bacterium]|jgi:branched-chain amino acid transport system ATP-binding protein|nr:ATP-binding cassette domain-containing protein [Desulfobacteraceae bacterium]